MNETKKLSSLLDEDLMIVKRDGSIVPFNKTKIRKAVISAMRDGGVYLPDIARIIANDAENYFLKSDSIPTISQVEKYVFSRLIHYGQDKTAKAYESYRAIAEFRRQSNTTDNDMYEIVRGKNEYWNKENSNKDSALASTQRDYIAGCTSKDIAFRRLFPTNIIQAHMSGALHLHDLDYAIQPIHNCFSRDTKFITFDGMKSFNDYNDGDIISVLSLDGQYHNATVRKYGKQKLYEYTFYCGKKEYAHTVKATENHRWILKDGSETTSLKVGDKLCKPPVIYQQDLDFTNLPYECQLAWCKGFGLGDGVVEWAAPGRLSHRTRIRLCGEKDLQYLDRFSIEGCNIRNTHYENGDKEVVIYNYQKEIPNFETLLEMQCFFNGLYCADGNTKKQNGKRINYRLQSSKKEVIDFIRQYAGTCGLYITRERDVTGETTNFGTRPYTIYFSFNPDFYFHYTVLDKKELQTEEVWCLEVADTHNFILEYGIPTGNCCLINIKDMLENGTVINGTAVKNIQSFRVACTVVTQIIASIASGQFGGQSVNIKHLGKYLKIAEDKYYRIFEGKVPTENLDDIVKVSLDQELKDGVQTIQYQINTISCSNGQTPFVTLFLELDDNDPYIEYTAKIIYEVLRQRYEGVPNEFGTIVTPTFPKLIFVLDENNIHKDSKYRYIYDMAIKSSSRRMYPDYISAKIMRKYHNGQVFSPMGCRSFLTDWKDPKTGEWVYEGRFNKGVVSINLPQVGLACGGDLDLFWETFDQRLELCHEALLCKADLLKETPSSISPIHWQHGGLARLNKNETIDSLLEGGYSTISLGYIGLYELTQIVMGCSHTTEEGKEFALSVIKYMKDKCNDWNLERNLGFGLYGTPAESLCYRFAKLDRQTYGIIPGVTDKQWYTNSYHVCPMEEIDAFSKIDFESAFQEYSSGGCISYIEIPNLENNLEAVDQLVQYMYNHIQYCELNTRADFCCECGFHGEVLYSVESDKWYCPQCGCHDQKKVIPTRRTCGYLGSHHWNQGKTQEITSRILHVD